MSNFNCERTFTAHTNFVWCLQLINQNCLASGSDDKTIEIWNLKNFNCEQTFTGHTYSVLCLQLIYQNCLASGSDDKTIKI